MIGQSVNYKNLGNRIKHKRKSLSMSQADLAYTVGLSTQHISNIENGRGKVSLERLVDIVNALNCSLDELLCESISNNRTIILSDLTKDLDSFTDAELRNFSFFLEGYRKLCKELASGV